LHHLILSRFGQKIASLTAQNLKRGKFGIISGARGRTGRLANSMWYRMRGNDEVELGDVRAGSNVDYALAQEKGFNGVVQVRSHRRSSAFGRPTRPYTVPTHRRRANIPAHFYQRGTIEDFFGSGSSTRIANGAFDEHKRKMGW